MKALLETNSEAYLKRLARDLTYRDSMYDKNGRIYAFEGKFIVDAGKLMHGTRQIDVGSLVNGHGESICVTRKP
jgi:hypothetical protein